ILLNGFLRCAKKYPQLRLLYLGEGSERAALEQCIQSENLIDRVRLVGNQKDPAIYYRCADMFVLPSAAEGLSNSLLEAMASGLPSIVTTVGHAGLIEDRKNGLLVPLDQSE